MKVLVLSASEIDPLINMKEALVFAERAYSFQGEIKKGTLPAHFSPLVAYEVKGPLGSPGFFDFRSGYIREIPIIISTMGYGFPENKIRRGLPGAFAVSLISDIDTGVPIAIMDADFLASMRTGAASAIASKYLARKNSRSIALIGTGHLARNMLDAHIEFGFPIDSMKVWSRSASNREEFAKRASEKYRILAVPVESPGDAIRGADIVCCCTPSQEPRVMFDDIKPGVHINAFGADSPGKQEVEPKVLTKSKTVVDDLEQCSMGGEIHKALQSGLITTKDVYAEIGEIVLGEKPGRTSGTEITLMDGTGLAVQDIVIFYETYKIALEKGVGNWIQL
ncbi:MAG: NAD(P)-binding domain-containing protein [Thaumarchaeota archaeon]|nr:NAD(P)-binding domain-containing protein [Nitrososphaerota archaeon]